MNLLFLIIIISAAFCLKRDRVLISTIRWTFAFSLIHGFAAFLIYFGRAENNLELRQAAFLWALFDLGLVAAVILFCFGTSAALKWLFIWRKQTNPPPLPITKAKVATSNPTAAWSKAALAVRELAKAGNLLLLALVVIGLLGLRRLNSVPDRLKVYDEHNRIETAADLFGSYYRPIKEDEDAGAGVRYNSLKDAEEAWERYDSPRLATLRLAQLQDELNFQAEQKAAEEQRQRQEQERQSKQWQELAKMDEWKPAAWRRWNEEALEENRQARIRRVAQEQADTFAREATVRRAFPVNGRTPRARLVKWPAY